MIGKRLHSIEYKPFSKKNRNHIRTTRDTKITAKHTQIHVRYNFNLKLKTVSQQRKLAFTYCIENIVYKHFSAEFLQTPLDQLKQVFDRQSSCKND